MMKPQSHSICVWVSILFLLCVVNVVWVVQGHAQTIQPGAEKGMVLLLPGVPVSAVGKALSGGEEQLLISLDAKISTVAIGGGGKESDILDVLRSNLLLAGIRSPEKCKPVEAHFSELLRQAAGKLAPDNRDVKRADDLLKHAESSFRCGTEVVSPEAIAEYFRLHGMIEMYRDNGAAGVTDFKRASMLQPGVQMDSNTPGDIKEAFELALTSPMPAQKEYRLPLGDLKGLDFRINGLPCVNATVSLPLGIHFVQLLRPLGEGLAGAIVEVTGDMIADSDAWFPETLKLPLTEQIIRQLLAVSAPRDLHTDLRFALEELRKVRKHAWILVLIPSKRQNPTSLWILPGGQVDVISPPDPPDTRNPARGWLIGFGTCAFTSGIVYGFNYFEAAYDIAGVYIPLNYAIDAQVWGRASAIACSVGTLISRSIYVALNPSQTLRLNHTSPSMMSSSIRFYPSIEYSNRATILSLGMEVLW